MNVLVLAGDRYHPALVPTEGLEPLRTQGWNFDIVEDGSLVNAALLSRYQVVLNTKSEGPTAEGQPGWLTAEVAAALQGYVEGGGGLLVVHSGAAGMNDREELRDLFGGLFAWHPAQLEVAFEPKAGHPLTEGVQPFAATDEHYFMNMAEGPMDVFMTSRSRHGAVPAGWCRTQGQGRVAMLTPGHNVPVWLNVNFQRLLTNTLRWCAGEV